MCGNVCLTTSCTECSCEETITPSIIIHLLQLLGYLYSDSTFKCFTLLQMRVITSCVGTVVTSRGYKIFFNVFTPATCTTLVFSCCEKESVWKHAVAFFHDDTFDLQTVCSFTWTQMSKFLMFSFLFENRMIQCLLFYTRGYQKSINLIDENWFSWLILVDLCLVLSWAKNMKIRIYL